MARAVSIEEWRWKAEWGVHLVEERFGRAEALRERAPSRHLAGGQEQVGGGGDSCEVFLFCFCLRCSLVFLFV